jgi:PAS domain S-box-containing protein
MKKQSAVLALKTSVLYAFGAGLWIFLSDKLLNLFIANKEIILEIQTYKGFFFVVVTSILLFTFLRRHLYILASTSAERALAGTALKESEQKFSNLFNYSPLVHAVTELSTGIYLEVNDKFLDVLQYSRREIVGHSSLQLNIWAHPDERKNAVHLLQTNGIVNNVEASFKRKDGDVFPGLISMCPIELNGVQCILTIASDISELRTMQRSLQQMENRNFAIMQTMPDLFFIQDKNGVYLDFHAPADANLLLPPDQFLGKEMKNVLPKYVADIFAPAFENALQTHEMQIIEYSLPLGNGEEYFEARIISHEKDKILSIVRDITVQKKAQKNLLKFYNELEKRVEQRTEELTAANKELEAFSYSVSHDLRAPLRAIDGFSSMLADRLPSTADREDKRLVQNIRTNIEKMDGLIDGLLTLSRVGRSELKKVSVPMTGYIRSIYNEVIPLEERSRITFAEGDLPDAPADLILIRQVWMNLISNAIKYSAYMEHPIITITGTIERGMAVYSITDNGAGFDQQNSSKLFGIFQRLHSKTEFDGLGIGLSIVKRIVQRHGGEVRAQGKIGEGATFSFSLPLE